MTEYCVVLITCSTKQEADDIAAALVSNRLAACVNAIKEVNSLFKWEGNIEKEDEVLLVIKTRQKLLQQLIAFVKERHSYKVPEIIALPILGGSEDYLSWLDAETA